MSKHPPAAKKDQLKGKENNKGENKTEEITETIGYGKFEFQNKILYIGSFRHFSNGVRIREGKGKLIHPSSDNTQYGQEFYEGDWKNDKMEGYGIYNYSNGDVYEGQWLDNMHHGTGKMYFTDGSRYEGEWKEHRMHGTGSYWDINNVNWSGEFREGQYISKDQAKLKEEKRILKKIAKMQEIPFMFLKQWEETLAKIDKKNVRELITPFFAKLENMSVYVKENFPKFEDRTLEKWNDAIKFVLNSKNNPNVNVCKNLNDFLFLNKNNVLTSQLQEDLSSGQIIEIQTKFELRTVNLGISYHRDLNRWLIVHFSEIIEKKNK
jgi:hypothetical protein